MPSQQTMQGALLAAIIATALSVPALADEMMPQPVHRGNVTYISGGIGWGEQRALRAAARNYNLEITNADRKGEFTAGTNLVIESGSGHDVLHATDTGPLFYAVARRVHDPSDERQSAARAPRQDRRPGIDGRASGLAAIG